MDDFRSGFPSLRPKCQAWNFDSLGNQIPGCKPLVEGNTIYDINMISENTNLTHVPEFTGEIKDYRSV